MKKILTAILLLSSISGISQTDAKTALKKFWKLASFSESKGKWNSKLEGSMANSCMHFRDGGVLVQVEDGDADKASWRYDESAKKLQITFQGTDEAYTQDYQVISLSETQLELEMRDEDGSKIGLRFSPNPYPFFPRLPALLADLVYNLDIPFNEANTRLKQLEYAAEKTEMSDGIKISHYEGSGLKILVYSKGNDVTGFVTDIATKDYRAMRTELKQKGYTESYDAGKRKLSYKNGNYHIIFHNIYDPKETGVLPVKDVIVAVYDLNQMTVK
ncbi:MAG TPA: hypothetical protein VMR70_09855 [Flavisolibacter sp.]|nr:hypothetical protein [Flavisolibacter sp.]